MQLRIKKQEAQINLITKKFLNKDGEIDFEKLLQDEDAIVEYRKLTYELEKFKSQLSRDNKPESIPIISYLWIGPPADTIAGHDTGGPLTMAKANKSNPILFWCLDEYESYYQEKFKYHKNITVCSIEKFLRGSKENPDAQKLLKIYTTCLLEEGRGSIRDRVTFKEALSLFLLQIQHGYIFDTNVIPLEKVIQMPDKDNLSLPAFRKNPKRSDLECWMLYSPGKTNQEARKIFKKYIIKWHEVEIMRKELLKKGKSLEEFYRDLGGTIMQPLFDVYQEGNVDLFLAKHCHGGFFADVEELGLRKTYNNTHRFYMRQKYDKRLFLDAKAIDNEPNEIFALVLSNNIDQLKIFIESRGSIHDVITKPNKKEIFKGETPLHFAIRYRKKEIVQLLLEAKADPELGIAHYEEKSYSPKELIVAMKNPLEKKEYLDLLTTYSLTPKLL